MKLAYISTWKVKCGISTYSCYYLTALKKKYPEIEVNVLAEDLWVGGEDNDPSYNIVPYIECWNRHTGFYGVIDALKKLKPTHFHVSHEFGLQCLNENVMFQYIELLKQIHSMGIKIVSTYHDVPVNSHPYFKYYFEHTNPYVSNSIWHTETAKDMAVKLGLNGDVSVINHGVLLCPLHDKVEMRKKYNIPQDYTVLMSMGWFGGLKGVMELIDMMPEILKRNPEVRFYYVGGLHPATAEFGKPYLSDCGMRVKELGLLDKFKVTGFISEERLPEYYAISDLAVLNYAFSGYHSASGCSAKLVAGKVPIITTSGTYRNDELTDGVNCIKVPFGDRNAMVEAIFRVLGNKEVKERLIRNGYDYAMKNSWEEISKRYMGEVYV